jgi:5-formyltetrahydrofolate cyclo-ligase
MGSAAQPLGCVWIVAVAEGLFGRSGVMGSSSKMPESDPSHPAEGPAAFGTYSSPPCFMHELDPSFVGLPEGSEQAAAPSSPAVSLDWPAIQQWRKEKRAQLIERRLQITSADRTDWSARIDEALAEVLSSVSGKLVGFYWPFKGEYDARSLLTGLRTHGVRLALPVVVAKAQPLQFREWWPGVPMTRGVWNIPIPAEGEPLFPDILLAPLVGFDAIGFRLGYGGGFYDRTIAAMPYKPQAIGVGFELSRLDTIHPQPHDMRMDVIVTERQTARISAG